MNVLFKFVLSLHLRNQNKIHRFLFTWLPWHRNNKQRSRDSKIFHSRLFLISLKRQYISIIGIRQFYHQMNSKFKTVQFTTLLQQHQLPSNKEFFQLSLSGKLSLCKFWHFTDCSVILFTVFICYLPFWYIFQTTKVNIIMYIQLS